MKIAKDIFIFEGVTVILKYYITTLKMEIGKKHILHFLWQFFFYNDYQFRPIYFQSWVNVNCNFSTVAISFSNAFLKKNSYKSCKLRYLK